jgi:hypothetical protein
MILHYMMFKYLLIQLLIYVDFLILLAIDLHLVLCSLSVIADLEQIKILDEHDRLVHMRNYYLFNQSFDLIMVSFVILELLNFQLDIHYLTIR